MIHPTIETLRRLRLTGMAKALEEQQNLPDCDHLSFAERLAMLVDREAVERDNAALTQRLRLAKLRQTACLEDIDYRTPRGLDRSLIHTLARLRMLMPLLVRLINSQIELADGVLSEVPDGIQDSRSVSEQIGSGRLAIGQEALLPDLHIEPVDRDVQLDG
jgi:IstB-like ATP binding protein